MGRKWGPLGAGVAKGSIVSRTFFNIASWIAARCTSVKYDVRGMVATMGNTARFQAARRP